jgi:hypothetical protein
VVLIFVQNPTSTIPCPWWARKNKYIMANEKSKQVNFTKILYEEKSYQLAAEMWRTANGEHPQQTNFFRI